MSHQLNIRMLKHLLTDLLNIMMKQWKMNLDSSYIEEVTKKAEQADAEVVRELRRAGINENIGNINAVNELMATGQLMAYTRKHGNQGSKSIYGENIIDSNDKA